MNRRMFLATTAAAVAAATSALKTNGASALSSTSQDHAVDIADFAFAPATIFARQGDRITWINKDIVPHTATAADGSWDTGQIGPGEQAEIEVAEGVFGEYFCRFHPAMRATIVAG